MPEQFIHFSHAPLTEVRSVEQPSLEQDGAWFKPHGLWFSVEGNDDGWKWWCEAENFHTASLARQTEIILHADANVLRICGADQLDAFDKEWGRDPPFGLSKSFGYVIDWPALAEKYDGIIIAPYVWERRMTMHSFWYYSWDCASGCVWNAKAIKELRALPCELDRAAE